MFSIVYIRYRRQFVINITYHNNMTWCVWVRVIIFSHSLFVAYTRHVKIAVILFCLDIAVPRAFVCVFFLNKSKKESSMFTNSIKQDV